MPEGLDIDLDGIAEPRARELIRRLLNLLEEVMSDLRNARAEIQRLRDEINRLKGEQGKPKIKANTAPPERRNDSSEAERQQKREWSKSGKADEIRIDREEVASVDPQTLPADAEFKGYEEAVVQDVIFKTDNVLFRKEKWYSPSEGKTYLAALPAGYEGQFGPGIKTLALVLYYGAQTSEPKVLEYLRSMGVLISAGQVSNLLIKDHATFHDEKDALYAAALAASPWQNVDDTGTRVNGQNQYCHIVTSPLHTTYFTKPAKDRLTIIDVLRGDRPRQFVVNAEALDLARQLGLSALRRGQMAGLPRDQAVGETSFLAWLEEGMPGLGPHQRQWVLDAAAIAAYHAETEFPVLQLLVVDGAPQFNLVTEALALCWVHEGRHYKKLVAYLPRHAHLVETFLKAFWAYYGELLAYREHPTPKEAQRLSGAFDTLFAQQTGYRALDERLALTAAKKDLLLAVLAHPELPLHNNAAELGARARVRKRDVSFGPRTKDGAKAWDTFMTLAATAGKLGVSFHRYILDRVSGTYALPSLAELIRQRAPELELASSWRSRQDLPPPDF
jgi:hypothetical protein